MKKINLQWRKLTKSQQSYRKLAAAAKIKHRSLARRNAAAWHSGALRMAAAAGDSKRYSANSAAYRRGASAKSGMRLKARQ
jgi:hypothetical protein